MWVCARECVSPWWLAGYLVLFCKNKTNCEQFPDPSASNQSNSSPNFHLVLRYLQLNFCSIFRFYWFLCCQKWTLIFIFWHRVHQIKVLTTHLTLQVEGLNYQRCRISVTEKLKLHSYKGNQTFLFWRIGCRKRWKVFIVWKLGQSWDSLCPGKGTLSHV